MTRYHLLSILFFFFFNDTPTPEIYTLSLHDALPISFPLFRHLDAAHRERHAPARAQGAAEPRPRAGIPAQAMRSEEHTSELQSRQYLVCRLLLEKKKKKYTTITTYTRYNEKND